MLNKEEVMSVRVRAEMKAEIKKVANEETRSVSQICELLLAVGLHAYKKSGSKIFKAIASQVQGRPAQKK